MAILHGKCHCGRIEVDFETAIPPAQLQVRACQCSFCRRHGAKTVTDPNGRLIIQYEAGSLDRYRFGLRTADFLLCRTCGVYVAALFSDGGEVRATLNAAGMMLAELSDQNPEPVHLDHETVEVRRTRRKANWTPTTLVERTAARRSA